MWACVIFPRVRMFGNKRTRVPIYLLSGGDVHCGHFLARQTTDLLIHFS